MSEPVTSDERISFMAATGAYAVFDRPARCALCSRCLLDRTGHCRWGGPFPHDEGERFEITYYDTTQKARLLWIRVEVLPAATAMAQVMVARGVQSIEVQDRKTGEMIWTSAPRDGLAPQV